MLRPFIILIKLAVFSTVVLIIGNSVQLRGHTLSDEVRVQMAHAERSDMVSHFKSWANGITRDASHGIKHRLKFQKSEMIRETPSEDIAASERQKLRALIQELNSSRRPD